MKYYPEGTNNATIAQFDTLGQIKQAINNKDVFEGKVVMCDKDHNLHIDLGVIRGVIPRAEGAVGILEGTVRDIALISKVNKFVCFRIMGLHRDEFGDTVAILSRRNVQLSCIDEFISKLSVADVITARVTHLEKFGAFIDIGAGVNSLIPIDMLSVSRINHPCERVQTGMLIKAVLRKKDGDKLTFSQKELLGTWQENSSLFSVGETVTGIVRSVESYGVFVELMPNLAGLAEPCNNVEVGTAVSVFIKSIIPEKMKIKLVIVEKFSTPAQSGNLVYFDERNHIDDWYYSPPNSAKNICTIF